MLTQLNTVFEANNIPSALKIQIIHTFPKTCIYEFHVTPRESNSIIGRSTRRPVAISTELFREVKVNFTYSRS
jgi:predicted RNA-binding protein YlqC (UPF0109 family)